MLKPLMLLLTVSTACAVDALILGFITRAGCGAHRPRYLLRRGALVGGSHAAFAALGMLMHAAYAQRAFGALGDVLIIGATLGLVMLAWVGSRPRFSGVDCADPRLPLIMVGVDATVVGMLADMLGVSFFLVFPVVVILPSLAFILPQCGRGSGACSTAHDDREVLT